MNTSRIRRDLLKSKQRVMIINKALKLIENKGNFTMRELSQSIGYSLPFIYQFFENKKKLLDSIYKQ